jgi:hypothetical protein
MVLISDKEIPISTTFKKDLEGVIQRNHLQ